MGDLRRENAGFSLKCGICKEITRGFRIHGGFANRKSVIFGLNGVFAKRKRVIFGPVAVHASGLTYIQPEQSLLKRTVERTLRSRASSS